MKQFQTILLLLLLSSMLILSSCTANNFGGKAIQSGENASATENTSDSAISAGEDGASEQIVTEGGEAQIVEEQQEYDSVMKEAKDSFVNAIKSNIYNKKLFFKSENLYKRALEFNFADVDFIKNQLSHIDSIVSASEDAANKFNNQLLPEGEFNSGTFKQVLGSYEQILKIEPKTVFAEESIKNIQSMLNLVNTANDFLAKKDYPNAQEQFKDVLNSWPYSYAKKSLEEIEDALNKYDVLIENADEKLNAAQWGSKEFTKAAFVEASNTYQKADEIMPSKYVTKQIESINYFLNLGPKYGSLIIEGNYNFKLKEYKDA